MPLSARKKTLVYSFTAIAGVFLVIETVLRILGIPKPQEPQGIEFTTSRGEAITLKKGRIRMGMSPFMVYRILPNQRTANFSIDSNGFRGPSVDLSVRKDKRIFVIGGSAAFGLGAATDEVTFVGQLAQRHSSWQVVNAGVTGYLSGQELSHLVHKLIDYKPDVVVAFDGWNDLFIPWYNYASIDGEFEVTGFREIEGQLISNYMTQAYPGKSFIRFLLALGGTTNTYNWVGGLVYRFIHAQKPRIAHRGSEKDPELFEKYLSNYISNIQKMAMICQSQGIRFLLMLQPDLGLRQQRTEPENNFLLHTNNYDGYPEEFSPLYRRFLDRVKTSPDLAPVEKIDTAQTARWLNTKETLFLDWVHLAPTGHIAVADILDASL